MAPKRRHKVLKCMGCISVTASFIMGQFNPQQRVRPVNNPMSLDGKVWSDTSFFIVFIPTSLAVNECAIVWPGCRPR
jgi:hypothetical protein